MMMQERSPEEIIKSMSIEDAYNTLILEVDDAPGEKVKYYARFGISIHFDIYEWINETMQVKGKKGIIILKGRKYELSDVWTEIEQRNIIIKKYLLGKVKNSSLVTSRT